MVKVRLQRAETQLARCGRFEDFLNEDFEAGEALFEVDGLRHVVAVARSFRFDERLLPGAVDPKCKHNVSTIARDKCLGTRPNRNPTATDSFAIQQAETQTAGLRFTKYELVYTVSL